MAYGVEDGELLTEICSVYNGWIAEFCAAAPSRLKGIAMLNVDDVGTAVKELERGSKMGLIGGMITVQPPFCDGVREPGVRSSCGRRRRTWGCR